MKLSVEEFKKGLYDSISQHFLEWIELNKKSSKHFDSYLECRCFERYYEGYESGVRSVLAFFKGYLFGLDDKNLNKSED